MYTSSRSNGLKETLEMNHINEIQSLKKDSGYSLQTEQNANKEI